MLRSTTIVLVGLSLAFFAVGAASATPYTFYGLPDIFGGSNNQANGINNSGQVVGVGVHASGMPTRVSLEPNCRADRCGKPGARLRIYRVCHQRQRSGDGECRHAGRQHHHRFSLDPYDS